MVNEWPEGTHTQPVGAVLLVIDSSEQEQFQELEPPLPWTQGSTETWQNFQEGDMDERLWGFQAALLLV